MKQTQDSAAMIDRKQYRNLCLLLLGFFWTPRVTLLFWPILNLSHTTCHPILNLSHTTCHPIGFNDLALIGSKKVINKIIVDIDDSKVK